MAKISTCFTVSTPRSASRSRSGSSMSAVYPVCSAIIALTVSMAETFKGAPPAVSLTALTSTSFAVSFIATTGTEAAGRVVIDAFAAMA